VSEDCVKSVLKNTPVDFFRAPCSRSTASLLVMILCSGGSETFSWGGSAAGLPPWFWVEALNRNNYRFPITNYILSPCTWN